MGTILITGATGNVGAELVHLLHATGRPLRAAVRDTAQARARLGVSIEYVPFDFEAAGAFDEALRGVSQLFLVRPPALTDTRATIAPLIAAARRAGVEQVVFLSLLGAEHNRFVPHYAIERTIQEAGIPWTFLRASFFMQNLSTTHRAALRERGEIDVPAGAGRTSFIDVRDIAEIAATVMTSSGHERAAYPLTGADALTYTEVAQIMTEELGRQIVYRAPSALAFARRMRRQGYERRFVLVMLAIYTTARLGLAATVTPDAARLLGRAPRTVRDFVRDYRDCWSGEADEMKAGEMTSRPGRSQA
jgi:uncharacterized protein YbjT (DUF2867 family)